MKMKIFVDTSAFIALFEKRDQHHIIAKEYFESLDSDIIELHTSNYVTDETITRIRIKNSHAEAVVFGEHLFSSKIFRIHYIDEEIERKAFALFKKYSDKQLSFTDCTSFSLMHSMAIHNAFAFDDDFIKVGFAIVP